ncbi:MAG: TonB-dependent receptor domain-containing protein [Bryobacteraceae bacterium]
MSYRKIPISVCLFLWFCALAPVYGQVTGRLSGTVIDVQGAAVPGAAVNVYLAGGQNAVLSASTNAEGLFVFTGIRPDYYDVSIDSKGFVKAVVRRVKIDPAQEKSIGQIKLDLATVAETVEVTAEIQTVQLANAEINTTVTNEQIRNLPVLDRQVISLITSQAGVSLGRGATVINGMRSSFATVTMDGINIQDNFIRSNGLNFIPNRITVDQVAEVSISTSNANATLNGGAAQVNFVTPSGTNNYHGNAYWYNRNSYFAANDWFNNKDGVQKPQLNQNQFGGSLGGPVKKDKLLFYFNYETLRLKQQELRNTTILTESARNGIFTYPAGGALQQVNILQARQTQADPAIAALLQRVPDASKANNFRVGDSRPGLIRNTIGYSFNQRDNMDRDNLVGKGDFILSTRHVFSGSYLWNREKVDRPDLDPTFNLTPAVANDSDRHLFAVGWRWTPSPTLTNELRGGANLSPGVFTNSEKFPDYLLDRNTTVFTYPASNFVLPQGRDTRTFSILDNASWMKGRHNVQMGFQSQMIRVEPYNFGGIYPTYGLGISANNTNGLAPAQLPGISSNELNQANNLLAALAGWVSTSTQTFNITSRNSGFVPRAEDRRNFSYNNYAGYVQDTWRMSRRLTLTLGLRYEYFTRLDERDGLAISPVLEGGNYINTMLNPNAVLDFAGSAVGRPYYNKDLNNFAPNVGVAWDVFGDGKTALRAGYSVNFVNDDHIVAVRNSLVVTNDGLSSTATRAGLVGRLTGSLPAVVTPTFKIPRTFAENRAISTSAAFGAVDPNLRIPYVQQWNIGIQREIKGWVVEGRYVGNKLTKGLRAIDYNQVLINSGGFLEDFKRAQNNGFLARRATGSFNANYNANIPGSQPLTVFPLLPSGGLLPNATVAGLIERGEVGQLASTYQTSNLQGPLNFFPNPSGIALNVMTNYSNSSYNALQLEVRRRVRSGLNVQANYTWSKVLSDSLGDGPSRFDPFLDINNAALERARAPFDLTHAIKGNFVYELPIGDGKRWNVAKLSRLLSGWKTGGFMTWQSGTPFSIFSNRGTLNRGGNRSGTRNTVISLAQGDDLLKNVGLFVTGNGPYFVNPSVIGADGRGVGTDGGTPYNGQIFFNPGPGTVGTLQRRMFNGPWVFNFDFSVVKETKLFENHSLEFRMESFNFFNNAQFYVGDEFLNADINNSVRFNVNNTTFGVINDSLLNGQRVFQFGFYYRF